jgi:hypothetical protein
MRDRPLWQVSWNPTKCSPFSAKSSFARITSPRNAEKEPRLLRCPLLIADYPFRMNAMSGQILEQFRQLPPKEQRELAELIFREATTGHRQSGPRRKTIAEIAGKYRPKPSPDTKDHDQRFAEAVAASKAA